MLNLLLISNSPKAESIKNSLQPLLKVIIDVVPDFDHGLKDVFEKRPATVCIQDHISGVTGESVARHIQMLLGAGAPNFILLHEANAKARAIKGLFDYCIDLAQDEEKLTGEVLDTLKSLLGSQWDKVYVPPKRSRAVIRAAVLPEETREDAEKLVDDFLSDLEAGEFTFAEDSRPDLPAGSPFPGDAAPLSTADELAELLLQQAQGTVLQAHETEPPPAAVAGGSAHDQIMPPAPAGKSTGAAGEEPAPVRHEEPVKPAARRPRRVAAAPPEGKAAPASDMPSLPPAAVLAEPEEQRPSAMVPEPPAAAASANDRHRAEQQAEPSVGAAGTPRAFTVSQFEEDADDLAFDLGIEMPSRRPWRRVALLAALGMVALAAGGGWYLKTHRSDVQAKLGGPSVPSPAKSPEKVPEKAAATPSPAVPATALPTFVPAKGHDPDYGRAKPGWERYVGTDAEYRLFRQDGKLKALQVVAKGSAPLDEGLKASVLSELAGTSKYQVTSEERRSGMLLVHARIAQKADLSLYMQKGKVRALVISLD